LLWGRQGSTGVSKRGWRAEDPGILVNHRGKKTKANSELALAA